MGRTSSERERDVRRVSVGLKDIYTHRLFFKKKTDIVSLLVKNKSLKLLLLLQLFHLCLCLNLLFMSKFFPFSQRGRFPKTTPHTYTCSQVRERERERDYISYSNLRKMEFQPKKYHGALGGENS
jgi:hypothetical protein